jgi:hypothetical protein
MKHCIMRWNLRRTDLQQAPLNQSNFQSINMDPGIRKAVKSSRIQALLDDIDGTIAIQLPNILGKPSSIRANRGPWCGVGCSSRQFFRKLNGIALS